MYDVLFRTVIVLVGRLSADLGSHSFHADLTYIHTCIHTYITQYSLNTSVCVCIHTYMNKNNVPYACSMHAQICMNALCNMCVCIVVCMYVYVCMYVCAYGALHLLQLLVSEGHLGSLRGQLQVLLHRALLLLFAYNTIRSGQVGLRSRLGLG